MARELPYSDTRIGAAFQKIIDSLVNDIIMPLIAALLGKVDFSDLSFMIKDTPIKYGNFITEIINFLIIAFSIFLAVKYVNKLGQITERATRNAASKLDKDGKIAKKLGLEEKVVEEVAEETVEEANNKSEH